MRRRFLPRILALVLIVCLPPPAMSQPVINEYLSSNVSGIPDEDGDSSDWIEICNPGPAAVNMAGYGLSDDESEPFKWAFPELILLPGERLLVYASGKDRHAEPLHWETVIDWGDLWKYRVNDSPPPAEWRATSFDDAAWCAGPSGIGYGDGDDATQIPPCISVSARKEFLVEDPSVIRSVCLHIDYEDAFAAWLNGVEVARANLSGPNPPCWDRPAIRDRKAGVCRGRLPATYVVADGASLLRPGRNVLAIEVHTESVGSADMTLMPFLTLGLEEAPAGGGSGVSDFIRFSVPRPHANFALTAAGETLTLHDAQGTMLDRIETGRMSVDISRGRAPDGAGDWHFFAEPTPEDPNGEGGQVTFAAPPGVSICGGVYEGALSVELLPPSPGAATYYTLDGSAPTDTSVLCGAAIPITATTVLRARTYEAGSLPSRIVTHSYILNDETTLPILSLVTDPHNLWDDETGIYVRGPRADPDRPYRGANFWQDWERPIHVEFFESDGRPGFRLNAGVKIHGGTSRHDGQKSLQLIARNGYGAAAIEYPVFDEKGIDAFRRLVLRNAGDDRRRAILRDALMHRLAAHTDLDRQAYRPARVYLNGEYWGIYNIREKVDRYYLESNHGVDPDRVDLLERHATVMEGGSESYLAMLQFIAEHGVADQADFAHVQAEMDTDNFATYMLFNIFYANTDWPGNNIRFWRPQTPGGRWRWILTDTDFGLGRAEAPSHNTLAHALAPNGTSWPNPAWSTFLLRELLENGEFKSSFINHYADHLNSSLLPGRTTAMAREISGRIEEEIPRHMEKWTPVGDWASQIANIIQFLERRPTQARGHLMQQFGLKDTLILSLGVAPPGGGSIRLAAISVDSVWSGVYFRDVPIMLTAVPTAGYTFKGWSDPSLPAESTVEILPEGDCDITARFEKCLLPRGVIVINEINYHSMDDFNPGDWVELYNHGESSVDLTGWQFRDEADDHCFDLPRAFVLDVGGFVVLCTDTAAFRASFPDAGPILGNLGFGFSGGGELLRLLDAQGEIHDWVEYDDDPPWPPEPDGSGPTLALLNPGSDNSFSGSWVASAGHGTPGQGNPKPEIGPAVCFESPVPNPLRRDTTVRFAVERPRHVHIAAYDLLGRFVALLARGRFEPGVHRLDWDGRGDAGRVLPSGIYWIRMDSEGFQASRRVVVLR